MNEVAANHHLDSALGRPLPQPGWLAGYAWLIIKYKLKTPAPPRLAAIAASGSPKSTDDWIMLRRARRPEETVAAHLEFALKYEGVDLGVLNALFDTLELEVMVELVRKTPLGRYTRRLWYLYEWLTGRILDVPDARKVGAVPVLDTDQQFGIDKGALSRRHRVVDNLPGTRQFCPLVRRTALLNIMIAKRLNVQAKEVIGRTAPDIVARAAAFLLLDDSRASFHIEGEEPTRARTARWAQAIAQAGTRPLSVADLERLQTILIGDARMVRLGLRVEGGFVGQHDRLTMEPVPDHISAKPEDLSSLMEGLVAYTERALQAGVDPVVVAAASAFGFVYVHPFEDGNGRLHRWLIHHVLSSADYASPGIVFPISAAILRAIDEYRRVLESYSSLLLPLIAWEESEGHNVRVLNDTVSFYRFFDATRHAEFLYRCVEQTVTQDLPIEVRYLEAYDRFAEQVKAVVEMPDRKVAILRDFLARNAGRFSQRAREKEFSELSPQEVHDIEAIYGEVIRGHLTSMDDATAYAAALREARAGLAEGGIPIGACLVVDGRILATGRNQRVQRGSTIRHGETDCIENAGRQPAAVYARSTLYTTLSPCPMCAGAILLYKIPRVVIGEHTHFEASEALLREHGVAVVVLDDAETKTMFRAWMDANPALWNEDIGVAAG